MKLCIIIPAYNESNRIQPTLESYAHFFGNNATLKTTILVVMNGCIDNTKEIVQLTREKYPAIEYLEYTIAGKGYAIIQGFKHALLHNFDLIGFVDADMATRPDAFNALVHHINGYDGVIASRYMPDSAITPPRPLIKRWGSRLIYEPLVWLLFGLNYYDLQCGAKLFTKQTIKTIIKDLKNRQWAFDVEILYLCKIKGLSIKEIPTVWHDQAGSKLTMKSGMRMLISLFKIRFSHSFLASLFGITHDTH